ncbi:hypothetical protein NQ318_023053 [Aromia moschata]|uniref:Uncharacterized protein n=1 Tax=Aromia moschata TaxID=1265417 RepID=A0AAV8XWS4_9CUCU|nr:hypothetical protein NQ318_023053 [Aromia moschata]
MKFFFAVFCTLGLVCASVLTQTNPVEDQVQNPSAWNGRAQRHIGNYHRDDHVDFGAHTGDNGAFGWYADFPV